MRLNARAKAERGPSGGGVSGAGGAGELRSKRRGACSPGLARPTKVGPARIRWADFDPSWWQNAGVRLRAAPFLGRDLWPAGLAGLGLGRDLLAAAAAAEDFAETTLPCGLRQDEVLDLMYRDINPEDYEVLSKLDEAVPKTDIAERDLVAGLPKVRLQAGGADECGVCLAKLEANAQVSRLPCQHVFHPECIGKWLTQCKNSCPLCSLPIDGAKA